MGVEHIRFLEADRIQLQEFLSGNPPAIVLALTAPLLDWLVDNNEGCVDDAMAALGYWRSLRSRCLEVR